MRHKIKGRSIKESFDNLPTGVCFADYNGIIVLCNKQMHRLCQILLGTDLQHIFELRKALDKPKEGITFIDKNAKILHFPDGQVWGFRESVINAQNKRVYTQMQALSLTELYTKKMELEEQNRMLEDFNKRAKSLYETLDKIVREEETFAIKMRVHSDIGLRLLSTHKVLREGGLSEIQEAGKMWQRTLHVLNIMDSELNKDDNDKEKIIKESDQMLYELLDSAAAIGISIKIDGNFPNDKEQSYLLMTAMMECATNTVRHAHGNEIKVKLFEEDNKIFIWIENDGTQPKENIVEGGGLSNLRHRIEKAGGNMEIQSMPRYRLIITLPRKEHTP